MASPSRTRHSICGRQAARRLSRFQRMSTTALCRNSMRRETSIPKTTTRVLLPSCRKLIRQFPRWMVIRSWYVQLLWMVPPPVASALTAVTTGPVTLAVAPTFSPLPRSHCAARLVTTSQASSALMRSCRHSPSDTRELPVTEVTARGLKRM